MIDNIVLIAFAILVMYVWILIEVNYQIKVNNMLSKDILLLKFDVEKLKGKTKGKVK